MRRTAFNAIDVSSYRHSFCFANPKEREMWCCYPETGETEAAAMVWRGLAQLQLIEEKRLKAAGIMPYSGITP